MPSLSGQTGLYTRRRGIFACQVISAVYGDQALLRASLFLIVFNCLVYTYGIQMMSGNPEKKTGFQWKKIANMGVIACILSLALYLLTIPLVSLITGV
ncbi:hypothetical protein [Lachnoclostridium sp. An196]|uniref:hypothetical protein n=1 Tax=Lachnoclostridium sp. An196 TaxID=1965583 RepID=UPI00117B00E6|nr:hypothetical protein [Lachnoclostridium sp. An196]